MVRMRCSPVLRSTCVAELRSHYSLRVWIHVGPPREKGEAFVSCMHE
jgi:hypothetical protein